MTTDTQSATLICRKCGYPITDTYIIRSKHGHFYHAECAPVPTQPKLDYGVDVADIRALPYTFEHVTSDNFSKAEDN